MRLHRQILVDLVIGVIVAEDRFAIQAAAPDMTSEKPSPVYHICTADPPSNHWAYLASQTPGKG